MYIDCVVSQGSVHTDSAFNFQLYIYIYINPVYVPKGQELVAYTKTHSCVKLYMIDYLLNIRSTT